MVYVGLARVEFCSTLTALNFVRAHTKGVREGVRQVSGPEGVGDWGDPELAAPAQPGARRAAAVCRQAMSGPQNTGTRGRRPLQL